MTDRNKAYLEKRWSTHCASTGTTNLLTLEMVNKLKGVIIKAQPRLYQTTAGHVLVRLAINEPLKPDTIKKQITMAYTNAGIKACVTMHSYIGLAPLVLAIPSVKQDAVSFLNVYNALHTTGRANFPYAKLFGKGQDLNHAMYPNRYYCALKHYSDYGALGPADNFVWSNIATRTQTAKLDKYCRYLDASGDITEEDIQIWKENAKGWVQVYQVYLMWTQNVSQKKKNKKNQR